MTFLEAIRKHKWIRRRNGTRVYCVPDVPTHLYSVCRADLLAEDWEPIFKESVATLEPIDPSAMRFSLLELDE